MGSHAVLRGEMMREGDKTEKPQLNAEASVIRVATTYFPTTACSIIGAAGLNFSVRNGKRWTSAL